ncbi:MAG: PAS domain S-box protein, partial [Spirochaetaceae bacterium]|nr:PAS domain S-box protein [Spirochaetaceae bacterium]
VHLALRRIGIEATISTNAVAETAAPNRAEKELDGAIRAEESGVLLIDADRLHSPTGDGTFADRPRLTIAVAADDAAGRAAVRDFGAFDYLSRADDDWAGRAASYVRALCSLRKRLAGAFGALERRYEDLVHALPDIVYELDASGRFTFVNNSIRMLGYEPKDLVGRHFSVLLYEEDAAVVDRDSVLELFKGVNTGIGLSPKLFNERRRLDRKTENLEVRLRRKPGSGGDGDLIVTVTSYGEVTAAGEYSRRGGDPDFVGSVGVIRDITLRRKSEEMLRKLYQAVDQLAAGILVADRAFRIEYVNPGFFRIAGLPPQEVIGEELFSFFDFKSDEAEDLRSQVRAGFDARAEVKLALPEGREGAQATTGSWTALHASPVRSPSGVVTHAILICEDISHRKAMEELVRIAKEEAERANRAKSDFLASMSHELKSPVASVLAAARLIEMGGSEPERRATSIIVSAQGLLAVLGDILDFVRFETGTGIVRKFAFPLPGFIARICDPYRKAAAAKGLVLEIGNLPDETLRSDPDRLGRALSALLDNAVSFTESGKVRVDASIERKAG